MNVIIGYIGVLLACFGGYALAGGHLVDLWQPVEIVVIVGCAAGALFIANSAKNLLMTLKNIPQVIKPSKFTKTLFLSMLCLLFEVLTKIRKEGLMSVEKDVEEPEQSVIFQKYPDLVHDHHVFEFLTDYLRMMVSGNLNPVELETLMDSEIDTHHQEGHVPVGVLTRLADGLPAFGIVAAVMGVVHTMGSVGIPPSELGKMIGAALVGTFLGILIAYGFVGPLAIALEQKLDAESKIYHCMKTSLLASMQGYAPQVAVEFGRKVLFSSDRPSFSELDEACRSTKGK